MTVVEAFDPNEIRLTDNAVSKVRALVADEGNRNSSCSAFTSPAEVAQASNTGFLLMRP